MSEAGLNEGPSFPEENSDDHSLNCSCTGASIPCDEWQLYSLERQKIPQNVEPLEQ